jgi:hypothetical protein
MGSMKHPLPVFSAICGLALLTAGCASQDVEKYLGKDPYLVFPLQQRVDQMTLPDETGKPSVDWGMTLMWMGDHYLLSADRNTTPGAPTQVWRVVALQDIPLLKSGQMIAFGSCRNAGVLVPGVVAVVQYDPDQRWFDRILGAWSYTAGQPAFVDFPSARLSCLNPRYGLGLDTPPASATAPAPAAATNAPIRGTAPPP